MGRRRALALAAGLCALTTGICVTELMGHDAGRPAMTTPGLTAMMATASVTTWLAGALAVCEQACCRPCWWAVRG